MKPGIFFAQLNTGEKILRKLALFAERANPSYATFDRAALKNKSYVEIWQQTRDARVYDFRLVDDSLMQFYVQSYVPLCLSYSYYECPFQLFPTWEDYLKEAEQIYGNQKSDSEIIREYEYLTPSPKSGFTPLRYDYSPNTYRKGCHPASHMHFGHDSNLRVTTKRILRPISFILFVIRQCYPEYWLTYLEETDAKINCRNVCDNLDKIDKKYFDAVDMWEMHLA